MKKLLIILLSALSLTAFAQQKKVAVYVTGQQSGINKVLGDQLVAAFAKSGKYIAIERTASFLAELGKEQNYQRTGAVDDNELSRLGKQFGVQLVCVADVSDVFGEKYVSSRLIDVESAEVINTSNATSKLDNMQELLKVTDGLAKELTAKTVQEKAAEVAAEQKEHEATEKMLIEGFANGFIKAGNLYATISFSSVTWNATSEIVQQCRVGGYTDWRIPTITELNVVKQACRTYYSDIDKKFYPNLSFGVEDRLVEIYDKSSFWVSNGTYIDYRGYNEVPDSKKTIKRLLLVRDAK